MSDVARSADWIYSANVRTITKFDAAVPLAPSKSTVSFTMSDDCTNGRSTLLSSTSAPSKSPRSKMVGVPLSPIVVATRKPSSSADVPIFNVASLLLLATAETCRRVASFSSLNVIGKSAANAPANGKV